MKQYIKNELVMELVEWLERVFDLEREKDVVGPMQCEDGSIYKG